MLRILVTGGAGFIGSHVVDAYIAEGHEVAVIDDLSTGFRENVHADAQFFELDIRSDSLGVVFKEFKPDVVNHLAAQMDVRKSLERPRFDAEVNIVGTINVLENCVHHGVGKIVFASTGGAIYGEPDELPAAETCPTRPVCHYGVSKRAAEYYVHLYNHLYKLRFTILRFPNVYGPRQNPHGEAGVCAILAHSMLGGKVPTLYGFGTPLRDYVYVSDIAQAHVKALERGDGTTLNLGSGKGTSVRELFETYKAILDIKMEPVLMPLRSGEIDKIYTTGDRAAEVLGWTPATGLREGLERTLRSIQELKGRA